MDECAKEKNAHKLYKKENSALKAEYNIIRLKVCCLIGIATEEGGGSPWEAPPPPPKEKSNLYMISVGNALSHELFMKTSFVVS